MAPAAVFALKLALNAWHITGTSRIWLAWGVFSMPGDADLEIGLRWDHHLKKFEVSMRFEIVGSNVDEWLSPDELLDIDVGKLQALGEDEPAYGKALTEMVLRPTDLAPLYLKARDAVQVGGHKLHVRLHISANAPACFHMLRWESLRDPETDRPIATQSNVLFSRYLSSPDWHPIPALAKHDLRALVVVPAPDNLREYFPEGHTLGEVRVEEELERAETALTGCAGIKKLTREDATLVKMLEELEQGVDILYLICHGALIDDVPLLYLENPDQTVDAVDGRRLVERLSELDRRPTVVMLCSCQSAGAGIEMYSTGKAQWSALGPQLAIAGVAAVVAMQGNISMATANIFAPAFFRELAEHGLVDQAMAAARRSISGRRDWWIPVLFSRLRSGRTYYTPKFAARKGDTWGELIDQIETGNITPVLGPELASGILGSRQDLARRWVRQWQMPIAPNNQSDVAKVAQYLRVRNADGTVRTLLQKYLMNEIRKRVALASKDDPVWNLPSNLIKGPKIGPAVLELGRRMRANDKRDPYRVIAALEVPIYITTSWTDLLEDALREHNREPITMMFSWNKGIEAERDIKKSSLHPTVQRPIVYHLYGRLDDRWSLVLSEDDYFTWLSAWNFSRKSVPPAVRAALTSNTLVFLGFHLGYWDFSVLFHSIKSLGGSDLLPKNPHIGVQLGPESPVIEPEAAQEYLESYLGEDRVSIYWGETRHFLDELCDRMGLVT